MAGGDKAAVTEDALRRRRPADHEVSAEFGAFVGYSGIRFARIAAAAGEGDEVLTAPSLWHHPAPLGVSFEVDPVHASVARHFIDLAALTCAGEVWLGLLQDTLPLLTERCGARSEAFGFMDQRGTTFHDDLATLERLQELPPNAVVAADNVTKPGAPVFLWHMTRGHCFRTAVWSMSEFASDAIEDWQSVSVARAEASA